LKAKDWSIPDYCYAKPNKCNNIHGAADINPKEVAIRLKCSFEKADLFVFVPAGHFPFVEKDEAFIKIVRDFLKK